MALSRTIRDALEGIPKYGRALIGWDGSDIQIIGADSGTSTHAMLVTLVQPTGLGYVAANQSGNDDGAGGASQIPVAQFAFNGSTYDRVRTNMNGTLLASAARTASVDSADITNYNAKGVHIVIDATAASATPSVVFTVQGKDALSGKYYTILASAAITGISTTVLRIHPGLTAAANLVANDLVPRTFRVSVVAGDADSLTYSVGYSLIV